MFFSASVNACQEPCFLAHPGMTSSECAECRESAGDASLDEPLGLEKQCIYLYNVYIYIICIVLVYIYIVDYHISYDIHIKFLFLVALAMY
jgi:hypothetical protein